MLLCGQMYMRKKLVNILYNLLGFTQKNNVIYFVGVGPTSIATVTEYIQKFNETFINPCPFRYEYMLQIIVLFMFPTLVQIFSIPLPLVSMFSMLHPLVVQM